MKRSKELMDMATDELLAIWKHPPADMPNWRLLAVHHELQRRKKLNPEAYEIYEQLLSAEDLTDPTGTKLTPSYHGESCLGNGEHEGIECCCDECDYYQACFPDWYPGAIWDEDSRRFV